MENDSAQFDGHIAGIYVTSSDALKLQPALVMQKMRYIAILIVSGCGC